MNIKSQSVCVLVELLGHSPLKGEELQFVGWVMGLGLHQAPASIGDDAKQSHCHGSGRGQPQNQTCMHQCAA